MTVVLPAACRTDDRDTLAGVDLQVEILDQGPVRAVGEMDVLQ